LVFFIAKSDDEKKKRQQYEEIITNGKNLKDKFKETSHSTLTKRTSAFTPFCLFVVFCKFCIHFFNRIDYTETFK